ncbi:hypothetical protein G3O06_37815 [Burkholderia sp. Ac-20345]|uniref:hypothetical protein n=1 Tax=Burkholderia sp. Ac-20345 TaxID=2703891 RepID=UPI00197CABBA|nr:hypothetical protein [Burkholderia sp. Ac-20345]MBN3783238.1 hypothetical protein [Burkholderia sp. Ac-20345]
MRGAIGVAHAIGVGRAARPVYRQFSLPAVHSNGNRSIISIFESLRPDCFSFVIGNDIRHTTTLSE